MALVYKITNDVNDKVYIGITINTLKYRFKNHCKTSVIEKRSGYKLYNAMKKYGKNKFHIHLLEEVLTWKDACRREQEIIKEYNTFKNGYNSTLGGEGNYGHKASEETRRKMSLARLGKKLNYIHPMKGKKLPPEIIEKMCKVQRELWKRPSFIESHRQAMTGKKHTQETKHKIGLTRMGKPSYHRETIINGIKYNSRQEACERLDKSYMQLHYMTKGFSNN
jgi:group I intron endonuclease